MKLFLQGLREVTYQGYFYILNFCGYYYFKSFMPCHAYLQIYFLDFMEHQDSLSPTSKAYENTPVYGQRPKVREETRDKQGLHTTGYSVMSQRKLAKDPFRSNRSLAPKSNLCFLMPSAMTSNIVSPGTRRPFSAMDSKTRNVSIEEIREQHWGKI